MVKITVFISFFVSFTFNIYAQNQHNILNIDSVLLQSTLDTLYAKWHESELSLQNENANLLWYYSCSFDSLDLVAIQFDETILLKAINAPFFNDCHYTLLEQSWLKKTLSSIVIFKRHPFSFPKEYKILYCVDRVRIEVRVFDSESREIARYNGYEYAPINHVSDVYKHLHIRLVELKDKAIFSPNFPGYFVPYKWFGAITSDNQLVWYNIYEPRVSYSSKELFENHWNEFVISKH
jgi:hypothetical protein